MYRSCQTENPLVGRHRITSFRLSVRNNETESNQPRSPAQQRFSLTFRDKPDSHGSYRVVVGEQASIPLPKHGPFRYAANAVKERDVKPSLALTLKRSAIRDAVSRFPTKNPRVFGSALRGTDREGSDLDLLVDALPGATLFDLGGLQVELEELLGVPVDLLTPEDLPPKVRAQVLAEAQPI